MTSARTCCGDGRPNCLPITDGWNFSGITGINSGSPFTPGFSTTNSVDFTGTPTSGARIDVVGELISKARRAVTPSEV